MSCSWNRTFPIRGHSREQRSFSRTGTGREMKQKLKKDMSKKCTFFGQPSRQSGFIRQKVRGVVQISFPYAPCSGVSLKKIHAVHPSPLINRSMHSFSRHHILRHPIGSLPRTHYTSSNPSPQKGPTDWRYSHIPLDSSFRPLPRLSNLQR